MENRIRRTIYITEDMLNEITNLATSRHIGVNEAFRIVIKRGISLQAAVDGQDEIRKYIREEIETTLPIILKPITERLIKMQAKATRASSAALMSTAGILSENYTNDIEPAEILAQAFKQAAVFMKTQQASDDEYLLEARTIMSVQLDKGAK